MSDMAYRQLGSSGLNVSVVGIGCNNFGFRIDEEASAAVVSAGLEAGVNLFDTAASYGASEERLGKAIVGHRDEVVIATKWPSPFEATKHQPGSRHHIVSACEGSLQRLGTDYIDLYQMHRPDPLTPIDETLHALDDLVTAGKVRYIGSSNFAGWQIADADWTSRTNGWARMVSAQNNYSLLKRDVESEVIPACRRFGVGMLPFFPLASGVLTGKYKRGEEGPEGSRLGKGSPMAARAGHVPQRPQLRCRRGAREDRRGCGRVASPPRDGRARRAADGGFRDRGRHDSGAGAGERRGGHPGSLLPTSSLRSTR